MRVWHATPSFIMGVNVDLGDNTKAFCSGFCSEGIRRMLIPLEMDWIVKLLNVTSALSGYSSDMHYSR